MRSFPTVSVVLLARNEGAVIGSVIAETKKELERLGLSFEVLVVDGGSRDDTRVRAESAGAQVLLQRRIGYGGALREGFLAASGEYVLTFDADGSHPTEHIEKLWEKRDQADIIIASRFVRGGTTEAPPLRQFLSRVLNQVFSTVLDLPIKDLSSGYRLYRRSLLVPQEYRSENFNILQEVLVKAYADGYSVAEVPLCYRRRESGKSNVSLVRFGKSYLKTLYELWVLRNSVDSADYDHRAYDSIIPLQRYWQRRRYSIVTNYLDQSQQTLDIGCGSSRIIQSRPNAIAFDYAFRKLRYLRRSNPLRVCGTTFMLPFVNNVFDQVVHSQVLEHVPFEPSIFLELNRVMKNNGILVVGTPDYGRIWWPLIEFFYGKLLPNAYADEHITHYTRQSLIDLLAEYGFRTLSYRYICGGELIVQAEKLVDL